MSEKLCTIQTRTDGYAVLTIPGNPAASPGDLLEALQRQLSSLSGNNEVKGLLLADSARGFCRCTTERSLSARDAASLSDHGQQLTFRMEKFDKPCIAVIEGECSGLGLEIALAADFIVASRGASFGFPGISAGLIPFCGGSQRLARLIGKSKTKELLYSGDLIDAEEAYRIRLVNRLYDQHHALAQAEELLAHICTRSPHAIRTGGEVVNTGYDIDLQAACMLERNAFALCFASSDQREGMQAFLDKRPPQFTGE